MPFLPLAAAASRYDGAEEMNAPVHGRAEPLRGKSWHAASAAPTAIPPFVMMAAMKRSHIRVGWLYKEIITPDGSDITREKLWNMAEAAEKRKDGTTAREYEIALPSELPEKERIALAKEFAEKLARVQGVAVDVCIHAPSSGGDDRNYHAHLLTTTRQYAGGELGKKADVELSDRDRKKLGLNTRKEALQKIRSEWARKLFPARLQDWRPDCLRE